MSTNAQVAYQAAAVKGEQLREADLTPRVASYYNWLQTATTVSEVQTLTVGGSGLTSFTVTFSGQTTAPIAANATAGAVQAALEALSNIEPGDVVVTGAAGGPYTLAFGGNLADTDVPEVTATPTGGSGTVTPATMTAGGGATAGHSVGDAQTALVGSSLAYVHREGADSVGDVLARAANLLSDIAAHTSGQGT